MEACPCCNEVVSLNSKREYLDHVMYDERGPIPSLLEMCRCPCGVRFGRGFYETGGGGGKPLVRKFARPLSELDIIVTSRETSFTKQFCQAMDLAIATMHVSFDSYATFLNLSWEYRTAVEGTNIRFYKVITCCQLYTYMYTKTTFLTAVSLHLFE